MVDVNKLFSREALNKLRSPEKLDTLLQVTNPIGWMALVAVLIMLVGVVIWSIFGSFTVSASGMGILTDSGGVVNVAHVATGQVQEVYVHTGQKVEKGELLLKVYQQAMEADTAAMGNSVSISNNIQDAAGRAAQYDVKRSQASMNELVYSPCDGIIDEIKVKSGDMLQAGTPALTVRRDQERSDLAGVFYVPVDKGKRIEPGMTIQLSPNGADTSMSGSLMGNVISVSEYPVSQYGIQSKLANEYLGTWILQSSQSAVVEVKFELVKNDNDPSGYLWTSVVGDHNKITPGTFVTGNIIIERRPPIEKVFYKLAQWLRSR